MIGVQATAMDLLISPLVIAIFMEPTEKPRYGGPPMGEIDDQLRDELGGAIFQTYPSKKIWL